MARRLEVILKNACLSDEASPPSPSFGMGQSQNAFVTSIHILSYTKRTKCHPGPQSYCSKNIREYSPWSWRRSQHPVKHQILRGVSAIKIPHHAIRS
jgi:hypothetical protein